MTVLQYLASQFELEQEYTEKQVNELLLEHVAAPARSGQFNAPFDGAVDHATLRRKLMEERLMQRTNDGSRYWRVVTDVP